MVEVYLDGLQVGPSRGRYSYCSRRRESLQLSCWAYYSIWTHLGQCERSHGTARELSGLLWRASVRKHVMPTPIKVGLLHYVSLRCRDSSHKFHCTLFSSHTFRCSPVTLRLSDETSILCVRSFGQVCAYLTDVESNLDYFHRYVDLSRVR